MIRDCWQSQTVSDDKSQIDESSMFATTLSLWETTLSRVKQIITESKVSCCILSFCRLIWHKHSQQGAAEKLSHRDFNKSPRTCKFRHFWVFCLHLLFIFCVGTMCAAWFEWGLSRVSQGGREYVYYNTFTPYTMFSLWAWLSPVGPSRSQPLLSSNLRGLINQNR